MTSEPKVINRHHFRGKRMPDPWIYVGRGTALGNPFTVQEHGRDGAIQLYRAWLWQKLRQGDPHVLEAMNRITHETNLVCSCAPNPCHADVIVAAWRWMQEGMKDDDRDRDQDHDQGP